MKRLHDFLYQVEKRIQNPYGIVNTAALARLVRHDIPLLHKIVQRLTRAYPEMIQAVEDMITDDDLKTWGHPFEDLSDAVSKAGTDPDDLPNF